MPHCHQPGNRRCLAAAPPGRVFHRLGGDDATTPGGGQQNIVVTSDTRRRGFDSRLGTSAPGSSNARTPHRRSTPKWRNRQTRSAQNAVRGNSLVGSTPAFGTIRRRDVTAAMPALEAGGRKTVQVQPLSPVPINSRWDSVGARSRGRSLTVTNRSYAGLAEPADAPG